MTDRRTCRTCCCARRSVADEMDARSIKPMDVLDLTISQEMTEDGPWWSATTYWSPDVDE